MNIFRFFGDMSHILSFIILLHKIVKGKSAAGISLRIDTRAGRLRCPPASESARADTSQREPT